MILNPGLLVAVCYHLLRCHLARQESSAGGVESFFPHETPSRPKGFWFAHTQYRFARESYHGSECATRLLVAASVNPCPFCTGQTSIATRVARVYILFLGSDSRADGSWTFEAVLLLSWTLPLRAPPGTLYRRGSVRSTTTSLRLQAWLS